MKITIHVAATIICSVLLILTKSINAQKPELVVQTGHSSDVESVSYSPSGRFLASCDDKTIKIWEADSGRGLRSFTSDRVKLKFLDESVLAALGAFKLTLLDVENGEIITELKQSFMAVGRTPHGKILAAGIVENHVVLWDVKGGSELRRFSLDLQGGGSIAFNSDATKLVAAAWQRKTITVWDLKNGEVLRTFSGKPEAVQYFSINLSGKILTAMSRQRIDAWDIENGIQLGSLGGDFSTGTLVFSKDGRTLAVSQDQTITLWSVPNWKKIGTLSDNSPQLMALSPNGTVLVSTSAYDPGIKLWNLSSGNVLRTLPGSPMVGSVLFSQDGKTLVAAGGPLVNIWDLEIGKKTSTLSGSRNIGALAFSKDGTQLVTASFNEKQNTLWDVRTRHRLGAAPPDTVDLDVRLSPDKKIRVCGWEGIKLCDARTGKELRTLSRGIGWPLAIAFNPDGKTLAYGTFSKTIELWNVESGESIKTLQTQSPILAVRFSPTGMTLAAGSTDGRVTLWDTASGRLLCTLFALGQDEWVVIDDQGRFDASRGAQTSLMHFVVGLEPISFEQLKERYYEPGLLAKVLGHNQEPLRDVGKFENPKLSPDVKYTLPAVGENVLTATLTNRGGGMGRVQVFVNGKEFLADARNITLRQNPNVATATLNIDLSKATGVKSGRSNVVRIVSWNAENYISSRGTEMVWTAGGPTDSEPPEVYAIVGGISKYAGSQLNLTFAAKDAADIANAIALGAKRLFGADRVHLTLLSTGEDQRAIAPTKDNFAKAFAAARKAKPNDILIVYLAGHGITLSRGSDTYLYLTQEARTTDTAVLSDSAVRQQQTITSEELVDWIKQIPANKQVVMLDTCAAGAAQTHLRLVDKREASGDAIRAIDRAKDRTGSYILMGSAADAVSYEASQYGQGLLTYALLKGMKGVALRNDEFVDVSKLFQYVRDEVEQLARNIGGVQRPMIFAPKDNSFEMGQLKTEDKQKIDLAMPKPIILRPRFFDTQTDDDTLNLMKAVRAHLRDENFVNGGGATSTLIFVDDEEFAGGIRPTGRYRIVGKKVMLTLRLRRDGGEIATTEIIGTKDDVPHLANEVIAAVKRTIMRLRQ